MNQSENRFYREPATEAAIERGWEITDRGLTIVPGVSFDEWSEAWTTICGMHRVAMWALGDCVRLGFQMFSEEASQIIDEYAPETTKVALWVSERIEPARRHPTQSWSAHRAVASLPPAEQDEILALAETNGWHSREVGAEVKRRKAKPANDQRLLPPPEEVTRVIDGGAETSSLVIPASDAHAAGIATPPLDIAAILDEIRQNADEISRGYEPTNLADRIIELCDAALEVIQGRRAA